MVDSGFMPGWRCLPVRTNKQPTPSTSSFITIQAKAEHPGTLLKISLRILQNSTDLSVDRGEQQLKIAKRLSVCTVGIALGFSLAASRYHQNIPRLFVARSLRIQP